MGGTGDALAPRRCSDRLLRRDLLDQALDQDLDLVPDRADGLDALAFRVLKLPVQVPLAGKDGAGVAAAEAAWALSLGGAGQTLRTHPCTPPSPATPAPPRAQLHSS